MCHFIRGTCPCGDGLKMTVPCPSTPEEGVYLVRTKKGQTQRGTEEQVR